MDILFKSAQPSGDSDKIKLLKKYGFLKVITGDISSKIEDVTLFHPNIEIADVVIFEKNDIENEAGENIVKKIKNIKGLNKKVALAIRIENKSDEQILTTLGSEFDYCIIDLFSWKIIPLENIIASLKNKTDIYVFVKNESDVTTYLNTLELGADGIVIDNTFEDDLEEFLASNANIMPQLSFDEVEVTLIEDAGMGDRVCIDTTAMLNLGEGMLIGSVSQCLFLIHSETIETEFVNARPFRVNAGAVHAYVLDNKGHTKYLSELRSGDRLLAVDYNGHTRSVTVGRAKIERRPMTLVGIKRENKEIRTIVQNAETIRFVKNNGEPVSVSDLKIGDKILVYFQEGGRHFGKPVDETILER